MRFRRLFLLAAIVCGLALCESRADAQWGRRGGRGWSAYRGGWGYGPGWRRGYYRRGPAVGVFVGGYRPYGYYGGYYAPGYYAPYGYGGYYAGYGGYGGYCW